MPTITSHLEFERDLAARLAGRDTPDQRKAVLVGAGAIGSHLADSLMREGRFAWTIIDDDRLLPHNLARHVSINSDVSRPKAAIVADHPNGIIAGRKVAEAIPANLLDPGEGGAVWRSLLTASLRWFSRPSRRSRAQRRNGVEMTDAGTSSAGSPEIGLALSGGGSRAIAFHLGCLRALHDLDILPRVKVISTVSGGSVIGALYAATDAPFPEFERRVRAVLEGGLAWPGVRTAVLTMEGPKALFCFMLTGTINLSFQAVAWLLWFVGLMAPRGHCSKFRIDNWRPPVRRFASRTTILRRAIHDELFRGVRLRDLKDRKALLIINAAELRTGSAFYFSANDSGSWRLGRLALTDITLAYAVTASAAFPMLLPALDEVFPFDRRDGSRRLERVSLTRAGCPAAVGRPRPRPFRRLSRGAGQGDSRRCDAARLDRCGRGARCHHHRHGLSETVRQWDRLAAGHVHPICGRRHSLRARATAFETRTVHWTPEFLFALGWLVFVLSFGAIWLLYFLIRRAAARRVVSLFYLTPPVTALMAWSLFGERLAPLALVGMAVCVAGVFLVNWRIDGKNAR